MELQRTALLAAACGLVLCQAGPALGQSDPAPTLTEPAAAVPPAPLPAKASLPPGTPVVLMLDQDLDTSANVIGDRFRILVAEDVVADGTVIIPKGTVGSGEITFLTSRGGFGKGGILQIAVRQLALGDSQVLLDGRYREEGGNNEGATAATMFAVGIFAGLIKGKTGMIQRGRLLKARTAEAVDYVPGSTPPLPPSTEPEGVPPPADAATATAQPSLSETPIPSKETKE